MDKTYITLKNIHLYSALSVSAFLLIYFISGAVLIMGELFPRALKQTVSEEVSLTSGKTESENIESICNRYAIHGEVTIKNLQGNKRSYSYYRPGYRAEIVLASLGSAKVKISQGSIWSAMNDFHRLRGYSGSIFHRIWAFCYDLSCVLMILLALTGLYLWWKLERKKKNGTIFLLISTGVTVFTIIYILAIC